MKIDNHKVKLAIKKIRAILAKDPELRESLRDYIHEFDSKDVSYSLNYEKRDENCL